MLNSYNIILTFGKLKGMCLCHMKMNNKQDEQQDVNSINVARTGTSWGDVCKVGNKISISIQDVKFAD